MNGISGALSSTTSISRLSSSSVITRILPIYIGAGLMSGRVKLSAK
jgi:hypothetical protein